MILVKIDIPIARSACGESESTFISWCKLEAVYHSQVYQLKYISLGCQVLPCLLFDAWLLR